MNLTGVKDIDTIILNKLDDNDLVNICRINKYTNGLCNDQMFWLNRILYKYPSLNIEILNKYKDNRSWSEYYINDLRRIRPENAEEYLKNGSEQGRLDHVMIAIEKGADVHYQHDAAIRYSSLHGHIDIVRYLVLMGANIHVDDDFAIKYSKMNRKYEVAKYLESLP